MLIWKFYKKYRKYNMEWFAYWKSHPKTWCPILSKKSTTKPRPFIPFLLISAFIHIIHQGHSILTRVMQADVTNKHQNFSDITQLKLISWVTVQIQGFYSEYGFTPSNDLGTHIFPSWDSYSLPFWSPLCSGRIKEEKKRVEKAFIHCNHVTT